jgi:hypothetical protein
MKLNVTSGGLACVFIGCALFFGGCASEGTTVASSAAASLSSSEMVGMWVGTSSLTGIDFGMRLRLEADGTVFSPKLGRSIGSWSVAGNQYEDKTIVEGREFQAGDLTIWRSGTVSGKTIEGTYRVTTGHTGRFIMTKE